MLGFFLLFCTLVAAGGYLSWSYYTSAMAPIEGAQLRVHTNAGVIYYPRGSANGYAPTERCRDSNQVCIALNEGDRIVTVREAGYGPVASLLLPDQSHIQLWAHPHGTDLTLERYQATRWTNNLQEVVLAQRKGYVRYDLSNEQPYENVLYQVKVDDTLSIQLHVGGSYSIDVPDAAEEENPQLIAGTDQPLRAEVATRLGIATVHHGSRQVRAMPGEKVGVPHEGNDMLVNAARWELIKDGDFAQYAAQQRAGDEVETWSLYWNDGAPNMSVQERNGSFTVSEKCRPETPDLCTPEDQVLIGQFRRDGDQRNSFITGISQTLDIDVSEYSSLYLSAWVRVLHQSVESTGVAGSECPIMIQLVYKETSPTDREQRRYFCVYEADGGMSVGSQPESEIIYRPVPAFQWYHLEVELRDNPSLRKARYLQRIHIEARGHDYISEIVDISLVGTQ